MLTADTITDEQIRELRKAVMSEWNARGKKEPWPEGKAILKSTMDALAIVTDCDVATGAQADSAALSEQANRTAQHSARARCAEILNARGATA